MTVKPDISPELSARIDGVAQQLGVSRQDVIRDALEEGHSLDWLEEWNRRVQAGIKAADEGDFATDEEMAALFAKYR